MPFIVVQRGYGVTLAIGLSRVKLCADNFWNVLICTKFDIKCFYLYEMYDIAVV